MLINLLINMKQCVWVRKLEFAQNIELFGKSLMSQNFQLKIRQFLSKKGDFFL